MPYRVTYGPPITTKAQKQDNFSRLRALTASFLVAFALLVRLFFPAGCAQLRRVLLPDPERPAADGILFLGAALALALADLELSGLSPGRMLLSLLLICTAYDRGAVTGVSAGLGLGLTADLCLDTGVLGEEFCKDVIVKAYKDSKKED